jgi:hypothetical protein
MLKLIERLDRMDEDRFHPAMIPPPPPPPPAPDNTMEGFATIMKAITDSQQQSNLLLVEMMKSNNQHRDPVADLANLTKLTAAGDDRLTTKDFLTMLPTIKTMIAPEGKNSVQDAVETLRSMKILEREFTPQIDPNAEQAAGFWDFLKGLVQSDAGARIADAVMAKQNADAVDQRHDQRRVAAQSAADAAQSHPQAPEEAGITIPESFNKHASELANAATPPERLKAGIEGLQHLAAYPDFRMYIAPIFGLAKQNRRIESLNHCHRFLMSLVEAQALEEDPVMKFLEDLDEHWTLVRSTLGMPDIDEVFPEGYVAESEEGSSNEESGQYEVDDSDPDDPIDPPAEAKRDPMRDIEMPPAEGREAVVVPSQEHAPLPPG